MKTPLRFHHWEFSYPAETEPAWSARVDRWYQLDASAYGLTELYERLKAAGEPLHVPSFVILASPEASNDSDHAFASTGTASAHKFAHTLPNIRGAPLSQSMGWVGPTLCLQNDPHTFASALSEAAGFVRAGRTPVWVLGVVGGAGHFEACLFELNSAKEADPTSLFIEEWTGEDLNTPDNLVLDWFHSYDSDSLSLPGGYRISRKAKA